jgi:hypothetical protein
MSMDLPVLAVLCAAVLAYLVRNLITRHETGRLRDQMLSQIAAIALFVPLHLVTVAAARSNADGELIARLELIAGLASGLGAVLGIAIADYLVAGRWRRGWYLLALFTLLPRWGHFVSSALWLALPLVLISLSRTTRDEDTKIRMQAIYCGTLGGGLLAFLLECFRYRAASPMGIEVLGPVASALFLYAGLRARRDPENEFSYAEIISLVRSSLPVLLAIAVLPCAILSAHNFMILRQFLVPAFGAVSCVLIVMLVAHFESAGIRTFLVLLLVTISITLLSTLYSARFETMTLLGFRLFSRVALVFACLFILKQYMRWGFEIAQTMVMIITALSSASIVFLVMYIAQPAGGLERFQEEDMIAAGVIFLDVVVLLSLPPVLVNYNFGTMKVTWAILALGIFFEVYGDFLSPLSERYEREVAALMGQGLIMLAFAVLWRYTGLLMQGVSSATRRLEST